MIYFLNLMLMLGCDGDKASEETPASNEEQTVPTDPVNEPQNESTEKKKSPPAVPQLKPRVFDHVDSVVLGLSQQPWFGTQVYSLGMMELGLLDPALFARLPNASTYIMRYFKAPSTQPSDPISDEPLLVHEASASGDYLLFKSERLLGVVETEENSPVALYVGSSPIQYSQFSNDSRVVLVAEQNRVAAVPIPSKSSNEEDTSPIIFEKVNTNTVKEMMLLSDKRRMVIHTDDGQVTLLHQDMDTSSEVLMTDVQSMTPYPNKDWLLILKAKEANVHVEIFDVNTQKSVAQFDTEGQYIGLMRPPHLVYVVNDKSISIIDTSTQDKAFEVQVDHPVINIVPHSKEPMLLIQTEQAYLLLDLKEEAFVELPKNIIDANFDTRGNLHYTSVKSKNSRGREYIKEHIEELIRVDWLSRRHDRLYDYLYDLAFREPYEDWDYQSGRYKTIDNRVLNVYQGIFNTSTKESEERRISDSDNLEVVKDGIVRRDHRYYYATFTSGKILGQDTDWQYLSGSVDFNDSNYNAFVVSSSVYTDDAKLQNLEYVQRHTGLRTKMDGVSGDWHTRLMPDGEMLYFHGTNCGWYDLQMLNHSVECTDLIPLNSELFAHVNYPNVQIVNVKSSNIIAKFALSSNPEQWGIDVEGKSLVTRLEDTFVILPDLDDPTVQVICTSEKQTEECTLGAWLDLGLPFSMLRPSKYKSQYSDTNIPVFSVDSVQIRALNIVGIYSSEEKDSGLYTNTLNPTIEDLDDKFYYRQRRYAFDSTGKWLRYATEKGFVEYHLPTGRRMLGVNVDYPHVQHSRFSGVEEWLLTSLRSSQYRICPNSYIVVKIDATEINPSELSAFVADKLVDKYCQYP